VAHGEGRQVPQTHQIERTRDGMAGRAGKGLDASAGSGVKGGAQMTTNTTKKAAGASNTNGLHTDTNSANFRSHGPINQAHDGKATATLIAQLALAGHVVNKGADGDFIATKWGQTCYCKDFAALAAFAKKVGAA